MAGILQNILLNSDAGPIGNALGAGMVGSLANARPPVAPRHPGLKIPRAGGTKRDFLSSILGGVADAFDNNRHNLGLLYRASVGTDEERMQGAQLLAASQQMDRQRHDEEKKETKNRRLAAEYAARFRSMGPDYHQFADALQSGAMTPGEAWSGALQQQQDTKRRQQMAGLLPEGQWRDAFMGGGIDFNDAYELAQGGGGSDENFYGNIVPMEDANGNVVLGQASDRGRWQPLQGAEGYSPAPTTKQIDAGNVIITTDIYGNELYRTPKTGDVPTAFQPNGSGGIEPMPGSDEARERITGGLQTDQRAKAADDRADIVIGAIDTALDQANWFTTGPVGSIGRTVGATPMIDLEGTINTIKSNIGFNELQQMREMSPTGGALGGIAIQELEMLQSVLASLDPRQGDGQLRQNLETIKTLLERQKVYRAQALQERQQALGGGSGSPAASQQGAPTIAINPQTGERVMWDGQQWVPVQ